MKRRPAPARPITGARRIVDDGLARELTLFQVYRFLSTSYLFAPILVLFFTARGLSMIEVTLLNSVYAVTAIVFEVPTGVLADRYGRRRAMVLGSLLMAAGCGLDYLGHSFFAFAVGEGLLALGMTLSSGADSAWLYDLLLDAGREHEYRRLEGAASASKLVGSALALALGGWLASRSVAATYLGTVFICLAASGVALGLREGSLLHRFPRPRFAARVIEGGRRVLARPALLFAVLFSTLVFTLVRMSIYLHQPYLSAAGFGLAEVGLVMALLSVGAALAAYRIDGLRRALGERALVVLLPLSLALSYALLGRFVAGWGVVLLLAQSLVNGAWSPFSKELINREIHDSSLRATVLSVESMVRRLAFGLFAPLAGLMMDRGGLPGGLYACAGLGGLGVALLGAHLLRRRTSFDSGFEGERTPTPLPGPDLELATEPLVTRTPVPVPVPLRER